MRLPSSSADSPTISPSSPSAIRHGLIGSSPITPNPNPSPSSGSLKIRGLSFLLNRTFPGYIKDPLMCVVSGVRVWDINRTLENHLRSCACGISVACLRVHFNFKKRNTGCCSNTAVVNSNKTAAKRGQLMLLARAPAFIAFDRVLSPPPSTDAFAYPVPYLATARQEHYILTLTLTPTGFNLWCSTSPANRCVAASACVVATAACYI